jgi:hypothetical protein
MAPSLRESSLSNLDMFVVFNERVRDYAHFMLVNSKSRITSEAYFSRALERQSKIMMADQITQLFTRQ